MSKQVRDLTGMRVGKLVVLEFAGFRLGPKSAPDSKRKTWWKCRCDCGAECFKRSNNLTRKHTQSCSIACGRPVLSVKAVEGIVFTDYQISANNRGLSFSLSQDTCTTLFKSPCYYCGVPYSNKRVRKSTYRRIAVEFNYNGIDRVDNSRGYENDNVVPCCRDCNVAKLKMSHDDFLTLCRRVASRHPEQTMQVAA